MEGRTAPSRALPPPPSLPGLVVAAGVVLGLALRLWMVASPLGPPDADEAVAGLMARDVLHGRFETFFWGQEYGGSQEALVLAALFRVGVPTRAAMELLALVGAAGVAVLVWRIARRLTTPAAAAVAGLAAWVGTPAVLWMT
ncbi:MAG TPA: hypothetical protein VFO65_12975, partial [Acidimicrobiales bacterium]|nr:hypothetical protein [Acidimicrobiales bacterium]